MSEQSNHEVAHVDYPKLPPRAFASLSPAEYIDQRLNQALSWYDASTILVRRKVSHLQEQIPPDARV